MAGFTNRGKYNILAAVFPGTVALPANYQVQLFSDTTTPTADTNLDGDLAEVPAGNGYTAGGQAVARNGTDFDVLTEDDVNDVALVQIKDLVWTAAGGNLPASGNGARWAGLCSAGAIGVRDCWSFFDLTSNRIVSDSQSLTLQDCEFRLTE